MSIGSTFRLLSAGLSLAVMEAVAQVPSTDIFLATCSLDRSGLRILEVKNITHRPGYDNQPAFTPDGSAILFTSIREDRQADIYRYDLESSTTTQLTRTSESEYSPRIAPGGKSFSVVRVEMDSTQRLWEFALMGNHPGVLLPHVKSVGYYTWIDSATIALFVLGQPPTLQIVDRTTGTATVIEKAIGRSLHTIPGQRAISFVHKLSDSLWVIKRYDLQRKTIEEITPTLRSSEDYCWLPDASLLMAQGSKLFRWRQNNGWEEVGDLASYGPESITRLAIDGTGTRLALVAHPRGEQ